MKHAEKLADKILFLKGEPTTKFTGKAVKGQEIPEMLKTNIGLESEAIQKYNEVAVICAAEKDQVSKDLVEELLKDEEDHLNTFENIRDLIDKLGAPDLATFTGK